MGVITLAETKELLNITVTTYDDDFNVLIPIVQDRVVRLTNNEFRTRLKLADTFTFSGTTVTANNGNFATEGFDDDDDVLIEGAYRNNGYYVVSSISTSVMTISTGALCSRTPVAELSGATIILTVVRWEQAIKPVIANMVWFDYKIRPTLKGIRSESLGPYSVSYASGGEFGYPDDIINGLIPWTKVRYI